MALDLAVALASLFSTADGRASPLVVQTLDEWIAARPDYQQLMTDLEQLVGPAVNAIDRLLVPPEARAAEQPDWPEEPEQLAPSGPGRDRTGPARSLWMLLDAEGKRLLASAMLLIVALELPLDRLPAPVAYVAAVVTDMLGRRFFDQLAALRQWIEPLR
jgi:hypothetical protein